jgi:dihydrolipoamide dehydrogenase
LETKPRDVDLIIIGSGPGGYFPAILAAQKGLSVALIEKGEMGGTCLNRGCIPTKALLREVSIREAFLLSGGTEKQTEVKILFQRAMQRKEKAIGQVVSGLMNLLSRDKIEVLRGEASFTGPHTVAVKRGGISVEHVRAPGILIATGADRSGESSLKINGQSMIGSDEALALPIPPRRLGIVGGGRRGVEYAVFFNSFGSDVTLIEREPRLLPRWDKEISVRYKAILAKRKIRVLTGTEAERAEESGSTGSIRLSVRSREKEEILSFDQVLLLENRVGNVAGLDLQRASIDVKEGFIQVDASMRTSSPGIYASGDVVGRGCLAHKAFHEGKTALENILGKESRLDYRQIPLCLYTSPEAASVGLSEEEALKEHGEVDTGKFPFMACGAAVAAGVSEGMVKILSEKKYGEILGVHILGPRATDLIHLGAMAMKHEIGVEEIKQMIFAHPTFSECFFEAALAVNGEAIHLMKG